MRYADSLCTYTETFDNNEHCYVFTGKCVVTGKETSVKVPSSALFAYRQGKHIQDAMPMVSKDDREFLMSGISAEGWKQMFGGEEE